MTGTKRVGVYVRVSSDEQAVHGTSLATQTERLTKHAKDQGWTLVADLLAKDGPCEVFADRGESGAKADRKALARLMAAVERKELDVVLVDKWDRLARSLNDQTTLWGQLDRLGVEYVSVSEPASSGKDGKFVRHIMAAVAEQERDRIRERTTLGRVARLLGDGGGWSGGEPPLGFRVQGKGREARLVLQDHEAAMIRRAVGLLLDHGMTTGQAATSLNAEGYLPRKAPRWTAALVRNHLMRGPWGGVWTYAKESGRRLGRDLVPSPVLVNVPAMLDADRHAALLAYLSNTTSARVCTVVHPLSGLLLGPCGHPFHGIARGDRGRRRYRCRYGKDNSSQDRCTGPTLLAQGLDDLVWGEVVKRLADPALLLAEAEEHLGLLKGAASAEADAYSRAQTQVEVCERALGDLFARAVKLGLDDNALQQAKATLEADLLAARQHAAMIATMREQTNRAAGQMTAMQDAARMADRLAGADNALRAQVLRLFQVRVVVSASGPLGEALSVQVTGFMDHGLMLHGLTPAGSGDLSLLKRTSRYGRNSFAGPNSGSSSASSASIGAFTHSSYAGRWSVQ